jgi:hypothetical protein
MPVGFEDDELDDMLDDEFGEEVAWTPAGGSETTLQGIFREHYEGVLVGETGYEGKTYTLRVKAADVDGIKHGDTITRNFTDYAVRGVHLAHDGFTVLALKEA